jgi:8-oxo-dGTP pyrophosphatase MutT (NUDIX family)
MAEPMKDAVRHRRAGRVLVIDPAGRVLLLHGFDPARRDQPYWFTVGGGIKAGESAAQAAARELREETGIRAAPAELGEPVWNEVAEFSFQGQPYRQDNDFFVLRVATTTVSRDGLEDEEAAVVDGHRWWTAAELDSTGERFYPAELPRLLRDLARSDVTDPDVTGPHLASPGRTEPAGGA